MNTSTAHDEQTFTFAHFDRLLQGRNKESRKLDNNTYLLRRGDTIVIRLYSTDIVTYTPQGLCILDSGGWNTVTTRARVSTFSPARMGTYRGTAYIIFEGKEYQFYDGMTLDLHTGRVTDANKPNLNEINRYNKELERRVKKYVQGYTLDVVRECLGDMGGDCWYCAMHISSTGKPLGELFHNNTHLWEHITEGYYMGSIICNAYGTRLYGSWQFALQLHLDRWESHGKKELHSNVKKYLMDALRDKNYSLTKTEE